jgi:hypothetical protein
MSTDSIKYQDLFLRGVGHKAKSELNRTSTFWGMVKDNYTFHQHVG